MVNRNLYLFGGMELQENGLNAYDFNARLYDPQLGRTFQPDPHADSYLALSPYSFLTNNPIRYADPTGMDYDDMVEPATSGSGDGDGVQSSWFTSRWNYRGGNGIYAAFGRGGWGMGNSGGRRHTVMMTERYKDWYLYNQYTGSLNYQGTNLESREWELMQLQNGGPIAINPPNFFELPIIRSTPLGKMISVLEYLSHPPMTQIKSMLEPKGKTTRISDGQMKLLKKGGFDPHGGSKPPQGNGRKIDFFKDGNGNIFWKQEGSNHYEPTFESIYDFLSNF